MPKVKSTSKDLVSRYLREFPNEHFRGDSSVLYCTCCDRPVSTSQRFQIVQHIATAKHQENKQKKKTLKQVLLTGSPSTASSSTGNELFKDLCRAFIQADIPFHKLNNVGLRNFLEKYIGKKIPDESTIRKNYLSTIYNETISKIREIINEGPIWASIDETTDVDGRYIANIIVGKLSQYESKPYLLNIAVLEHCNHEEIARFFNNSMEILWPGGILHNNVYLFLSDAAPYMVKAGKSIKVFYPKIIHVTCIAHGFHRVAEFIRSEFPSVDLLISTVKKIFLKAPSRVKILKESYPDLCLPPQPIITRWGTWLDAAEYYSQNFEKIRDVLSKLDSDTAVSINKAKTLMEDTRLENNLAFISANLIFIVHLIKKLETQNMSLSESFAIVHEGTENLKKIAGATGKKIIDKFENVLSKNKGLDQLRDISAILEGKTSGSITSFLPQELAAFKYAPITSVDVERSFSRYKNILRPDRRSFSFEHLKMYAVSNNFND